jgi:hypothetical protein
MDGSGARSFGSRRVHVVAMALALGLAPWGTWILGGGGFGALDTALCGAAALVWIVAGCLLSAGRALSRPAVRGVLFGLLTAALFLLLEVWVNTAKVGTGHRVFVYDFTALFVGLVTGICSRKRKTRARPAPEL